MRFPVSALLLFAATLALPVARVAAQEADQKATQRATQEAGGRSPGGALDEIRGEAGSPGPAPVSRQRRDALDADVAAPDTVSGMLRAAQGMIAENRPGPANELIERAESRLLTRSTAPDQADIAVDGGPVRWLGEARAALLRNDPARAQAELTRTLELLARFRPHPGMAADPAAPPFTTGVAPLGAAPPAGAGGATPAAPGGTFR